VTVLAGSTSLTVLPLVESTDPVQMLSRQDLTSPSRQDKNAGNSGDLVKHTVYLAMLNHLARSGKKAHIVEAHGGKGVYVSSNPHLLTARQAAHYSTSVLGRAQSECFASPPVGLGVVANLGDHEIAYAGSGALHASAVANGLADSLELLDSDAGVRSVANRVFSEDSFAKVRGNLRTTDPDGSSEPMVLSRLTEGVFGPDHVLHFDPFAFVMAPHDASMRALYRDLIQECDARVQQSGLAAASLFFTWGSNNAAAKDDLFEDGFSDGVDDGYQALIAAVHPDQRIVITWCWELYFSLLCIVPADARERVGRAVVADLAWLKPLMRMLEVDHGRA
jgi:hypothetical protein